MPRNRDNSFCCGAGGGRIWMREPQAGRPSEDRIHEAVALGGRVTQFVVACPKDVTMYEDAIKTTGSSDRLELAELSELVAEACLDPAPVVAH
jgi:Fe-S oxidoreductase